jgi:hypothetical protein
MREGLRLLDDSDIGNLRDQLQIILRGSDGNNSAYPQLTTDIFETIDHVRRSTEIPYFYFEPTDNLLSFAAVQSFFKNGELVDLRMLISTDVLKSYGGRKNILFPFRNYNRIYTRWCMAHELCHLNQSLTQLDAVIRDYRKLKKAKDGEEYGRIWDTLPIELDADKFARNALATMPMSLSEKFMYKLLSLTRLTGRE